MPNVLEVQIVGDVSSLEKSLKQAESLQAEYTKSIEKTSSELKDSINVTRGYAKAIDDLNKEYKDGVISSKDYSKQLSNLKRDEKESTVATADLRKELANLKKEQKEVGGAVDGASKKLANGSNALTQLSRIAQDAPFGINGFGNNITASAESVGYLIKQTGSLGGALKAVGASLLGGGGIIFAVSLLTSGLTYMAQNGLTVSDVFNKLTGTFDESKAAIEELNAEAIKGSQAQISQMNAYVSVATNVNLSMKDRLTAVQKLQDEYPAYFGNLTKEQILNGQVAGAVAGVTKALIAKAKAAAAVDKIVKLAEEEEVIQNKINDSVAAMAKFYRLNKKESTDFATVLNKQLTGQIDLVSELEKGNANNLSKTEKTVLAAIQYSATLQGLSGELQKNIAQQDKYTKSVNESTAAQIKLETEPAKASKTPKTKKVKEAKTKKDTFDGQKKLDELSEIAFKMQEVTSVSLFDSTKTEDNLNKLKDIAFQMSETVSNSFDVAKKSADVFSQGAGSAIGALGGELASSLETGNAALDAFTGSVIQSLADVAAAQLTGLIAKQAIATASLSTDAAVATGNAVVAGSETAAASGPAAAFVLPALVGAAIGFIAASFAGIKFAHGGIVPGGSYTGDKIPAMLNSGEAVMNSQQQANTLMAIANGNSNSLQGNRQSSNFTLETKLRGSDLLLVTKREERKR